MINKILVFVIIITAGCTSGTHLNLQKHHFNQVPSQIIWIQIPGLAEEHIASLKFTLTGMGQKTAFEQMTCLGKIWHYNLFELRPDIRSSLLSQIVGKKNITNSCDDYEHLPFWSYFGTKGIPVGILEAGVPYKDSLYKASSCGKQGEKFTQNMGLWIMNKKKNKEDRMFHFQQKIKTGPGVYFDKSCQGKECFSSVANNFFSIYGQFIKDNKQSAIILRDFGYINALKANNFTKAREHLLELNNILSILLQNKSHNQNRLILLTSASSRRYLFPPKGKKWGDYEKQGRHIYFKDTSLMSPVFASGAGAENYCGIYGESELLKRIIWGPEKHILDLKVFQ